MSSSTPEFAQRKLLLVEGKDDLSFFEKLIEHNKIIDMAVSSYNGKYNLGNDLSERVRNVEFQTISSLGIVRDADNSAQSAFHSVVGSLSRAKLHAPVAPLTPREQDGLRVSVLILPPGEEKGELEDVCLSAIGAHPDMLCVEQYISCLNDGHAPIANHNLAKAKLYAYLAPGTVRTTRAGKNTRRKPAFALDVTAKRSVWDWNSPAFDRLADFLRGM